MLFIMFIIAVAGLIYCDFGIGRPYRKTNAFDDSNRYIENEKIEPILMRYIGNKTEKIIGVLGKYNTIDDDTIKKKGICIVTEKAFYFIGNIYKKQSIITWKSDIRSRIPLNELREFKQEQLFPWYALVHLIYMVFVALSYVGYLIEQFQIEEHSDYIVFICIILIFPGIIAVLCILVASVITVYKVRGNAVELVFDNQVYCFFKGDYGERELKEFYKAMSKAQGELLTSYSENITQGQYQQSTDNQNISNINMGNKLGTLKELADLYEKKLITEEEYLKLKQKALGISEGGVQ